MKKVSSCLLGFLLSGFVLSSISVVNAEGLLTQINVSFSAIKTIINGKEFVPPDNMKPFIYNGVTYVPIRFIGEALGKEISWNQDIQAVIINDPQQPTEQEKYFEDSFTNALSDKWDKFGNGSWTFDGVNGIKVSPNYGSYLALTGINLNNIKNFTVKFDALGEREHYAFADICKFSFGTDEKGNVVDFFNISVNENNDYRNGVYLNDNRISLVSIKQNNFYAIKIQVRNKQANIYINDSLVVSQKYTNVVKQIFTFVTSKESIYYLKNFSISIDD